MGVRSTNPAQSFVDDFFRSGTDGGGVASSTAEASGGVKITSGNYVYHIFMGGNGPNYAGNPISAETFTISSGTITNAEILVVGGGGGAKNDGSGGGGAGAVYHATGVTLPSSPISITIGERGTGAGSATNGSDTTFGPVTAQGGGYGNDGGNGNPGGSGGGGGGPGTPSGGSSTASPVSAFGVTFTAYGNAGGNNPTSNDGGAGGGGAGAAGANRGSAAGTDGGDGRAFPSFPGPVLSPALPTSAQNVDPNYGGTPWPTATTNPVALNSAWQTATGPTGLFGGGGGGGAYYPVDTRAEGGTGGGGSGAAGNPGPGYAFPGLDYTGGGGGAATSSNSQAPGRPGGRGVVILRYS